MPIPAHENLYATAGVIRKKLEAKRAEMQAARLRARWEYRGVVFYDMRLGEVPGQGWES